MKYKRLISFLTCGMLIASLCSCSKKENLQTNSEKSLTHKICDEPLELSLFAREFEAYNDQNVWIGAYDKTNVLLKPTLPANTSNMDRELALAIAAKEVPDVVYDWSRDNFNKYGSQGVLIPLNDLIDHHAPNYKKFLEQNPDIKYFSTAADGNIYFIPFIRDGNASTGWFIRRDWLDKLGLEAPNNLQEFYDVMVAFKQRDPNGNGKSDEVPYFGGRADFGGLLSLFNVRTGFGYSNGKVSFGPLDDGFPHAISQISKWYREGLIDPEIFTRIDGKNYFTSSNTGGITHDWLGSTAKRNDALQESIPGFNLVVFAPPEGIDGVRREERRRGRVSTEGWGISSSNKHPVETIKYFDFWFTKEGRRMANFGIEGVHYDVVNGRAVFKDSVLQGEVEVTELMNNLRSYINFGYWQDYSYEDQWINQVARNGLEMYIKGDYLPKPIEQPSLNYLDNEQRRNLLNGQITSFVEESIQKWVLGKENIETNYNQFVEKLKSLGVDEYIAIEQKAYDNYLSQVAG